MSTAPDDAVSEENTGSPRLALLLAAAMFVLVVDTSLMNVSISAVVKDLRYDGERRPVGDRPGGAGLGGLHPDQLARWATSWVASAPT